MACTFCLLRSGRHYQFSDESDPLSISSNISTSVTPSARANLLTVLRLTLVSPRSVMPMRHEPAVPSQD